MTTGPLVSICTPTYRRPHYLKQLIDSVLAQTHQSWEMWICDNSEDDRTRVMLEGYSDPRIHYEKNASNLGMGRNVLKVLGKVTGSLFTFTPDDDLWGPDNLARKVAFLEANPDLPVVFSNAKRIDPDGNGLPRFRSEYFEGAARLRAEVLRPDSSVEHRHFVNILTALMRKELLPVFQESWHLNTEEYFMWYLGCRGGSLGFIGEQLLSLREAEHYRVVVEGGKLIDFKGRADYRQRQLADFYRCLRVMRPEVAPALDTLGVKRYVARAIVGSSSTARDLARSLALVGGVMPDPPLGAALSAAVVQAGRIALRPFRRGRDISGLGPVERAANGT
jgi:glycosyltransferase involved in cell wall biosynthesis